ncbi:ABC transporter [endosymbiont 'TC1' of Trimyema compressum]|uniref:metal ABC transporter ATP-binding protein n=1 Tax=endosymbiont 'TC1' of Trimyema compressum TaxID=243899 RepID=UPI0007F066E0|nr:ABC transporter ATP-binding protein [endosymbiont 'TC1' of Trimyema compressum]AMP20280.1 ABC transporter [endosymbiont 'TC1' of Trimyema compressum]
MDTLLTCSNLGVQYGSKVVLNNISFTVNKGDYISILGNNGAGKSTLLKAVLGLVSKAKGEILFPSITNTEIGYLPRQKNHQKDFPASVFEVVLSGCLNKKGLWPFYGSADKKKAKHFMEKLKISDLHSKSYRNLSGGQQRRALLARALCATEAILFLDEPVAGLDPLGTEAFYLLLEEVNKVDGMTIVMVSHDLTNALKYSNKIVHLDKELLFFGAVADYQRNKVYQEMIGGTIDA